MQVMQVVLMYNTLLYGMAGGVVSFEVVRNYLSETSGELLRLRLLMAPGGLRTRVRDDSHASRKQQSLH
jgi:hypothetical protein